MTKLKATRGNMDRTVELYYIYATYLCKLYYIYGNTSLAYDLRPTREDSHELVFGTKKQIKYTNKKGTL